MLGALLLVALMLTADLNDDVNDQDVRDDPDPDERRQDSERLGKCLTESEHLHGLWRRGRRHGDYRVAFGAVQARRGAGVAERARLEIA